MVEIKEKLKNMQESTENNEKQRGLPMNKIKECLLKVSMNLNSENLILNRGNILQVMNNDNKWWKQIFVEESSKNNQES